jgi:hypothetical protein
MPKYYVKSGQIRFIVDCTDHKCAIFAALTHYKGKGIITGPKICLSEQGFEDFRKWKCYDTDKYLKDV